jgi:hypothetical protein
MAAQSLDLELRPRSTAAYRFYTTVLLDCWSMWATQWVTGCGPWVWGSGTRSVPGVVAKELMHSICPKFIRIYRLVLCLVNDPLVPVNIPQHDHARNVWHHRVVWSPTCREKQEAYQRFTSGNIHQREFSDSEAWKIFLLLFLVFLCSLNFGNNSYCCSNVQDVGLRFHQLKVGPPMVGDLPCSYHDVPWRS